MLKAKRNDATTTTQLSLLNYPTVIEGFCEVVAMETSCNGSTPFIVKGVMGLLVYSHTQTDTHTGGCGLPIERVVH